MAVAAAVRQKVVADDLTDPDACAASSVPADEPSTQPHGRCGRARRQLSVANAPACRSRGAALAPRDSVHSRLRPDWRSYNPRREHEIPVSNYTHYRMSNCAIGSTYETPELL